MIQPYEEARKLVIGQIIDPERMTVPLAESRDLIAFNDIKAERALPEFHYAATNGYALRSEDTKGATREFPVDGAVMKRLSAGEVYKKPLGKNEAVWVVAGSLLPPGADTVLTTEDADRVGKSIKIYRMASTGENVRMKGEDVEAGEIILKKGRRIRAQEIALLASLGIQTVEVCRPPKVAMITTGAELAALGRRRKDGQIWNAITPSLVALIGETGGVPVDLGHLKEKKGALKGKIKEGLRYPVLVLAGGLFVREYDMIKELLESLHVKEVFWRVNIRPGRPIYFGRSDRTLVFGLPDTPGALFVGFEEFVRPVILKLLGRERLYRREITAVAGTDMKNRSRRLFFVRSFLRRNGRNVTVFPSGNQHSHIVKTLSRANALVTLEETQDFVRRGERVRVKLLD